MMTKRLFQVCLLVFAASFAAGAVEAAARKKAAPPAAELRAVWVTRFEWPDADPDRCREKIRTIFDNLDRANFNAAVFQVRGQADVLYPSPYEPWSPLIGGKDPGWDPLAFALEEAHQRGIELHAYVNPMPLWHSRTPPADSTPEHLYYRHGPGSEVSWLCHDASGTPMDSRGAGYYYLSPGIPDVHAYLRKVLLDLVERYDIDGIHYDRIRYPGRGYSHDPVSLRRFEGPGNPNGLGWEDWQREQLNKLINDLYAEIASRKPWLRVSCSAWGIYNRFDIPGYETFSSGYHDYYQDTVAWTRLGAMDTLMPMIYWDIPDPKPNYNELAESFISHVGGLRFVGGMAGYKGYLKDDEIFNEIKVTRELGGAGTVLFAYGSIVRENAWERFIQEVYADKAATAPMPWKDKPEGGILGGWVLDEAGEPIVDAVVELEGVPHRWTSSADGYFAFLQVEPGRRTLKITGEGLEARVYPGIEVVAGEVALLRSVPPAGAATPPLFRIISPRPGTRLSRDRMNVAIHTDPDNKVFINGEETHVYKTGISVLDNVRLEPGQNRFELAVETPAGFRITRIRWVERTPPEALPILPALPLQIEEESLQPRFDLLVQAGDQIPVRFKASPGHEADFRIGRRTRWQPMTELPGEEQRGIRGIYSGVYVVQPGDAFEEEEITIRLRRSREVEGATRSPSRVHAAAGGKITTLSACVPMVAEVTADAADLNVGLGEVRLGGPILTTVPKGTRLELTGKVGRNWRVRLSETVEAWVGDRAVRVLPPGTPPARDFLTSFTVTGNEKYDILSIPYSQKVPFRIRPVPEPNRLEIDLYGVTANTTWITIQEKAEGIKRVDWEQVEKDLYRLTVDLNYPQLWGYDATAENNLLRVRIKRPPELAAPPQSPVAGLTIAVEAGHGGPRNFGAVGLSGSREKDVNYGTATRLAALLEAAGAEVVMMRQGDETISLGDRIKRAVEGEADILISIHANAAGSAGGYLRVSGVSTYYKYTPWRPLADQLYQRLLEIGLNPWNVIGSFNYRPCLVTAMPAVLVELAFMSHPGDEELLVDPQFQQKMAEAIFQGLEDYLEEQRESRSNDFSRSRKD